MELRLDGKSALVTGAARRVGRAIALELGRAGARVIIHHHASDAEAADLAAEIRGAGAPPPAIVKADLREASECTRLLAEAGPLDVLVNSAAGFERKHFVDLDEDDWDQMLALNLAAPRRLSRGFAQAAMARQEAEPAVIVNILDIAATHAWRGYAHYCVAKAGLHMLTRVMAVELAPRVRVCGVAPGLVQPPANMPADERERLIRLVPMGREGSAADVAQTVRFLVAGPGYLNGVIVPVDGGRSAGSMGAL